MITKFEWRVRVQGQERVSDLIAFATEVERGLKTSELVPDEARVTDVGRDFSQLPFVSVEWSAQGEMTYADNYQAS